MTPYAEQDDIVALYDERLLENIAWDDDAEAIDTTMVSSALTRATDFMNSYIGARYRLPLATTPKVFVQPCVDIAVYFIAHDAGRLTDEIKDRFKMQIGWLKDVSAGRATLVEIDEESGENTAEASDRGSIRFGFLQRF